MAHIAENIAAKLWVHHQIAAENFNKNITVILYHIDIGDNTTAIWPYYLSDRIYNYT